MKLIIKNKRAYFDFTIVQKYIAGLKLLGNEVKSIRDSNVSIGEAYCRFINDELFVVGMNVAEYMGTGKYTSYDTTRDRKLLLNKNEINKLQKAIKEKGLTIIPLAIILTDTGFLKLEVGLARGKNTVDKRQSIKEKELKREIKKEILR